MVRATEVELHILIYEVRRLNTELTLSTILAWCERLKYRNALFELHILIYEVQTLNTQLTLGTIWGFGDRLRLNFIY